jgi:hypothetical protein
MATGVTNGSGVASANLTLSTTAGPQQITATFGGEPTLAPSSDQIAFTISPASTTLALTVGTGGLPGAVSDTSALLKAGSTPIAGRSVTFVATGSGATAGQGFVKTVTTDTTGVAALGSIPNVPGGLYALKAYFSGTIPIHPSGSPTITLTDPVYAPSQSATADFKVHWPLSGFFPPVDNLPIVNVAKAGSSIPVKFSLGGDRGFQILAGNPAATKLTTCGTGAADTVETTNTLTGGLSYDPASGRYQYNWKTTKGATGCYRLDVKLVSGQSLSAIFQLR